MSARETELQNLRKANPSTAPLHEKIAQLEEQLKVKIDRDRDRAWTKTEDRD